MGGEGDAKTWMMLSLSSSRDVLLLLLLSSWDDEQAVSLRPRYEHLRSVLPLPRKTFVLGAFRLEDREEEVAVLLAVRGK